MAGAAATKPVPDAGSAVLSVQNLQAWYGESHILHGMDFNVNAGEVVTLLGRNGAGKTTTLKSVMGIIGKRTEPVRLPMIPITDFSVVVLPAPLRPSSVTTSPALTLKSMP